jgi:hypothetical protein
MKDKLLKSIKDSIISHASKFNKSTTCSLGVKHIWEVKVISNAQGHTV